MSDCNNFCKWVIPMIGECHINSHKMPKWSRRKIKELIKKYEMDELTDDELTADFLKGYEYAVWIISRMVQEERDK